jgi:Domain of unknown function (DUF4391)
MAKEALPQAMFHWPIQARVGKVIAKSKIYLQAKPNAATRSLFVNQVESITWAYKLAPETINVAASPTVPEIEVFEIALKQPKLNHLVLRCIDNAIPFPILFNLQFEGKVQPVAAFKRASASNTNEWLVSDYFSADWQASNAEHKRLPQAIHLEGLYTQLVRQHIALPARKGEHLAAQLARLAELKVSQFKAEKLQQKLKNEVQFKYKVEINGQLRKVLQEIAALA